ncbi:hypothetical protein KO566_12855 [Flavobacteriaceae bacterium XHP0103]|uniref:hypothetical protein n=1 Tax=Marixanthotalea marina TaxID=2844359 RepID=UPI002989C236|nr:hypothetical protein [Marixanthotalea marina]MBU3822953.1 hypothetical protein [Marixanthotalea marina]
MKKTIVLLLVTLSFCCKNNSSGNQAVAEIGATDEKAAVVLQMEGETYTILQENLQPIKVDFNNGDLQYVIWQDGNPVQTNVNITDADIKTNGAATYSIPEDNSPNIKIDLNFYNQDRDASRMNKRIVFRKGIVSIKKISEYALEMTFEGEGGGMMKSSESFPIKGSINIIY